jgi:hypothetical protein
MLRPANGLHSQWPVQHTVRPSNIQPARRLPWGRHPGDHPTEPHHMGPPQGEHPVTRDIDHLNGAASRGHHAGDPFHGTPSRGLPHGNRFLGKSSRGPPQVDPQRRPPTGEPTREPPKRDPLQGNLSRESTSGDPSRGPIPGNLLHGTPPCLTGSTECPHDAQPGKCPSQHKVSPAQIEPLKCLDQTTACTFNGQFSTRPAKAKFSPAQLSSEHLRRSHQRTRTGFHQEETPDGITHGTSPGDHHSSPKWTPFTRPSPGNPRPVTPDRGLPTVDPHIEPHRGPNRWDPKQWIKKWGPQLWTPSREHAAWDPHQATASRGPHRGDTLQWNPTTGPPLGETLQETPSRVHAPGNIHEMTTPCNSPGDPSLDPSGIPSPVDPSMRPHPFQDTPSVDPSSLETRKVKPYNGSIPVDPLKVTITRGPLSCLALFMDFPAHG